MGSEAMEVGAEDLGALRVPAETQVVGGGRRPPDWEALGKMLPNSRGRLGAPPPSSLGWTRSSTRLCNRKAAG